MTPEMSETELERLLGRSLFDQAPFNVAVIDRDFRMVAANRSFEEYFGDWHNRRCHEVYKGSPIPCASCRARETFGDGRVRVSDETGINRHGRRCHYVVHLAPLRDDDGRVRYLLEMTTDLTETRRWQREYDLFFERVPCYILVLDRDFHVVRSNEKFRRAFGDARGRCCYQICKRRSSACLNCPAMMTFEDGQEHTSNQVGVHRDGTPAHYVVTSSPLSRDETGGIAHVIEMATDITELRRLESEMKEARDFYESLIHNSPAGILAMDQFGRPKILNPAARQLLEWASKPLPSDARLKQMLPTEFFDTGSEDERPLDLPEVMLRSAHGRAVPVRFSALSLTSHGKRIGYAAFMEDLREIKRLEREKLEAERLGAVGQTVAGLAHTIKNLLMGLEGGMYMVDSGLRKGDVARITNGWGILQRNFEKTTALVKGFLDFAKGRLPEPRPTDPNALAQEIVELYREAARLQGVELVFDPGAEIREAPLDPAAMETCLTNLVSNAVDAAALRREPGGRVVLSTRQDADELIFEVADNGCGMDCEVKSKVFTTFFTTKGGKGTGLGLLTTRKIVQEHGGRIEVESDPGAGSTFRIRLPRQRLAAVVEAASAATQRSEQVKP
jgi:signal transduction histidine kinase